MPNSRPADAVYCEMFSQDIRCVSNIRPRSRVKVGIRCQLTTKVTSATNSDNSARTRERARVRTPGRRRTTIGNLFKLPCVCVCVSAHTADCCLHTPSVSHLTSVCRGVENTHTYIYCSVLHSNLTRPPSP